MYGAVTPTLRRDGARKRPMSEALAVSEEFLRRFADAPEPLLQRVVADALIHKGEVLREAGQGPGALRAFEEILRRFGDSPEPSLREYVTRAMDRIGRTGGIH